MDEILELLANIGAGFLLLVIVVFAVALVLVTRRALAEIDEDKTGRP
jgi:hypothetical protein